MTPYPPLLSPSGPLPPPPLPFGLNKMSHLQHLFFFFAMFYLDLLVVLHVSALSKQENVVETEMDFQVLALCALFLLAFSFHIPISHYT